MAEAEMIDVNILLKKVQHAEKVIGETLKLMNQLASSLDGLVNLADISTNEVNDTEDTVKIIQDIATNTKILGFNASIEASRAKEGGKGFGVIAQEVRELAETSRSSADKIQQTMESLGVHSKDIKKEAASTRKIVKTCLDDVNTFSSILNEIKGMSSSSGF